MERLALETLAPVDFRAITPSLINWVKSCEAAESGMALRVIEY